MHHGNVAESDPNLPAATGAAGSADPQASDAARNGDYGFIFRQAEPWQGLGSRDRTAQVTTRLSEAMRDHNDSSEQDDNETIPAGYTYLGQLIVHDLTQFRLDPRGRSIRASAGASNLRTPSLDLDCIYGGGPEAEPALYQRSENQHDDFRLLLRVGRSRTGTTGGGVPVAQRDEGDVPRVTEDGRGIVGRQPAVCADPLIADARNDAHLLVSQLHLAFSLIHNRVALYFQRRLQDNRAAFQSARQFVRSCYRNIIREDYLRRVLCQEVFADLDSGSPEIVRLPEGSPLEPTQLPLEYALAAGRFGHAMARGFYRVNDVLEAPHRQPEKGSLGTILRLSGLSNRGASGLPVSGEWLVDWRQFFDLGEVRPNPSRKISPFLPAPLINHTPPFSRRRPRKGLVWHDLWRSYDPGLPSGQDMARELQSHAGRRLHVPVLTGANLVPRHDSTAQSVRAIEAVFQANDALRESTPLFYYLLQEAHRCEEGRSLGPLGSYIVALSFRNLLRERGQGVTSRIGDMPGFLALLLSEQAAFEATMESALVN